MKKSEIDSRIKKIREGKTNRRALIKEILEAQFGEVVLDVLGDFTISKTRQ